VPSRLVRLMVNLASLVVCISKFCAKGMPTPHFGTLEVVANPFDTFAAAPARNAARERYLSETGDRSEARIIGFVGNLAEQKRPFKFVEAAALINQVSPVPVSFAMFGTDRKGLAENLLDRADELGLGGRLHIMGFRHPIEPWIAACDILLAPEVDEGFGRTLVEAMLLETPVIASDSGGHREIIEHERTGFLVPPDDAGTMASMALELLERPTLGRAVVEAARGQVRSRYSATVHAERMMSLYRGLLTPSEAVASAT
jgi:glycosyltransferase involved in cell wall biosynthesis